ncbi:transposase [Rhodobacterales bacterium HKCCE3408]|nr:transposase [Rhodobacterales bacterium HKCCE3408]
MPRYRRLTRPDTPVFLTVCLAERGSTVLVDHIDLLRDAARMTLRGRPVDVLAWAVLPDHMHAVWRMPEDDLNYAQRWGRIKARFTRGWRCRPGFSPDFPTEMPEIRSGRFARLKPGLRGDRRECAVWQRRFWEHHCRDARDVAAHMNYCLMNPVKHGLVDRPTDWEASSIHRVIRAGRLPADWAGDLPTGDFGEAQGGSHPAV